MKEERRSKGLSREMLAELANISFDTVKRYENGTIGMRLDVAYDIACALDIPLQDLLPQRERDLSQVAKAAKSVYLYLEKLNNEQ